MTNWLKKIGNKRVKMERDVAHLAQQIAFRKMGLEEELKERASSIRKSISAELCLDKLKAEKRIDLAKNLSSEEIKKLEKLERKTTERVRDDLPVGLSSERKEKYSAKILESKEYLEKRIYPEKKEKSSEI